MAAARVKSSQVVDRGKAVEELKLAINRQSSTLIDKNWNEIFDALFQNASAERALYIKGTSKSSTRLSRSASAIRAVVQIAVSRLRIRTVKNVLDHIIHSIPTDQGLCEPLVVDYCKTLRCVLEYQPHVEHLRESWNDVMSFCVSTLSTLQETISDDSQSSNWSSGRSGSRINRASRPSYAGPDIDELVACIRQLCRAPNTPLQVHALDAAAVLLKHLKLSTSSGPGLPDALGAINLILARIVDTHVNWTQEIILEMLPKLSRLWLLKSNALKDQILIFLTTTFLHIRSSFQSDPNSHIRVDLERLFETMQDEYASRLARDQLRLDDLQLGHSNAQGALCLPDAGVFKLRDGSYEAESQWMTVYSMAWIGSIMDEIRSDTRQTDQAENGSRKKRRVMTNLEAILQLSTASNTNVQITSLQVLAFMAALNPLSKSDQTKLAESLISLVSHANHVVASWSMLALANCALQLSASDSLGHLWLRVWELASRAIPSKTTARAASLVLDILLRRKLVHYSAIVQSLENMLQFSELTGPGVLAESTVSFWLIAIRTMIHENPGSRRELHEKLLRWMFSKWMPSEYTLDCDQPNILPY
jgi:ataxia telangiectasia mutated family protein